MQGIPCFFRRVGGSLFKCIRGNCLFCGLRNLLFCVVRISVRGVLCPLRFLNGCFGVGSGTACCVNFVVALLLRQNALGRFVDGNALRNVPRFFNRLPFNKNALLCFGHKDSLCLRRQSFRLGQRFRRLLRSGFSPCNYYYFFLFHCYFPFCRNVSVCGNCVW